MVLPDLQPASREIGTTDLSALINKIELDHTEFFACSEYGKKAEIKVTIFHEPNREGKRGILEVTPPREGFFSSDFFTYESIARQLNLKLLVYEVPGVAVAPQSEAEQTATEKMILLAILRPHANL